MRPCHAQLLCLWLCACSAGHASELAAGSATVFDATQDAFSLPIPTLSPRERSAFFVGNSFFNQNWVSAPSTVATRAGLGPLFNARSCSTCHFKDGRGQPPEPGQPLVSMIVRLSVAADGGEHGAPRPHPVYGDQLQTDALPGLAPEADVTLQYTAEVGRFADGEAYSLRKPQLQIAALGYGALGPDVLTSLRVAPALIGVGLLEAVPEAQIAARADARDADHDGISGRTNRVWDASTGRSALGRMGWKAEQPSVRQQVASAFAADIGITSALVPRDACSPAQQAACAAFPSAGSPELRDPIFEAVVSYSRTLAVPARRGLGDSTLQHGEALFARAQCALCHVPSLRTGRVRELPELSELEIHPYTDLLLHDLGEGLADHRPVFAADGREWRTAPLWGVGLIAKVNRHACLLHDGRARGVAEAVLWHGGEAEASKQAFVHMTHAERAELARFVESL